MDSPRTSRLRARAGMTLIEVMVAMVLLVLGLMSVFTAMNSAAATRDRARCHSLALQAVQRQIEDLQAREWVSSFPDQTFPVDGLQPLEGLPAAGRIFRINDSSATIHHLRFRVDWVDRQGPGWVEIDFFNYNRAS